MVKIVCESCQSRFKVAEDKLAARSGDSLPCPKCKNSIQIESGAPTATLPDPSHGEKTDSEAAAANLMTDSWPYNENDDYSADQPFDFAEEESKTALVCELDPEIKKKIADVLVSMEYHITEAENARDALKRIRFHAYDLIVVNEHFDGDSPGDNSVMSYLERLDMDTRRKIIVVLISKSHRTMDHMMAYRKSVNMILHHKHIEKIGAILGRGLADRDLFYRVFKESQLNLGLA